MADLGDVLRGLGSVLNPQVMQAMEAENQQRRQVQNQIGMTMLQNQLAQNTPEAQARIQQIENEKNYRQELAGLGENPDLEKVATIATKYGKPEIAANLYKAKEDRAARIAQATEANDLKKQLADQQHQMRLATLTSQQDRQAEIARHNQAMEALAAQNAQLNAELRKMGFEIQRQGQQLQLARIEQTAKDKANKPIPAPLQKQLTETASLADDTERFAKTFKDEFGGHTITGGLTNVTGRLLGDESGQAQWWQDYDLHQSQVRNKLFGSALTATESREWEKSAISPRMSPDEIKKNLNRRNDIEQKALSRLINGAAAGGYSREQIEGFTGRGATPTSGKRLKFDDKGNPL